MSDWPKKQISQTSEQKVIELVEVIMNYIRRLVQTLYL